MEDEQAVDTGSTVRWVTEVVQSLHLARQTAKVLVVLAGTAFVLGIVASAATIVGFRQAAGASFALTISTAAGYFLSSFLPAGVLLAAAGFLRLYAIRAETDLLEDDKAD